MPQSSVDSGEQAPPLMFTGIQILEPRIFDYIPRGVFSHSTTDVYPQAIAKGERVAAHVAGGKWYELSTLQRYLDISLELLAERNENWCAGARSRIAAEAKVERAVLWDDVIVGEGARVNRSVLGDGVHIAPGELVEDAVVVRANLVRGATPPEKALKGEIRGENFVVPLAQ